MRVHHMQSEIGIIIIDGVYITRECQSQSLGVAMLPHCVDAYCNMHIDEMEKMTAGVVNEAHCTLGKFGSTG